MTDNLVKELLDSESKLSERLGKVHNAILARLPSVDRIACALYDPVTDLLKTFINSTYKGNAIVAYEYRLSDSASLTNLARTGDCRVINNIQESVQPGTQHSDWLLQQKYQSSFTVPIREGGAFLGFIFFDSSEPDAFPESVQRDLQLYSNLIVMTITSEIFAVKLLLATANAARDFSGLRDFETGKHLDRMALLSRLIARGVANEYALTDEFIEHLYIFAPLHDIGKIGIPDQILLKKGRLDPSERAIMETHVEKGVSTLKKVLSQYEIGHLADSRIMLNIVAHHHEYCDGSGYPNRLQAADIPVEAKIITVADIFDALTSRRPYKAPWSPEDAVAELERMAEAGKLDPLCVRVVRDQLPEAGNIIEEFADDVK